MDTFEPRHDKTNKVSVRPAKTQISLGIRPVWSESSLSARKKLGPLATHRAHSEDSDQTGQQRRLWSDWAAAQADLNLRWGHTHFVGFVMSRLILEIYPLLHIVRNVTSESTFYDEILYLSTWHIARSKYFSLANRKQPLKSWCLFFLASLLTNFVKMIFRLFFKVQYLYWCEITNWSFFEFLNYTWRYIWGKTSHFSTKIHWHTAPHKIIWKYVSTDKLTSLNSFLSFNILWNINVCISI